MAQEQPAARRGSGTAPDKNSCKMPRPLLSFSQRTRPQILAVALNSPSSFTDTAFRHAVLMVRLHWAASSLGIFIRGYNARLYCPSQPCGRENTRRAFDCASVARQAACARDRRFAPVDPGTAWADACRRPEKAPSNRYSRYAACRIFGVVRRVWGVVGVAAARVAGGEVNSP